MPALELPRVLMVSAADCVGVSRSRIRTEIRRGNWRAFARGAVLTRPENPTRADWADLGIALAGRSAALTGWDALRARGLGEARPPSDDIVVLSRHSSNRVIGRVRIRESQRPYSVETTPFACAYSLTPVVGIARAIADASLIYARANPVRALVTAAIQRRRCTLPELIAELEQCPRQGSRLLRAALSDAADGARSAAEAQAARLMAAVRLPAFELNVPIVRRGVVVYLADVLWRSLRAVLEIDSREYHFSEDDWKATSRRHNSLTRFGLAVTHYPPSTITTPGSAWTDEVAEWLQARVTELGVPLPAGHGVLRQPSTGPTTYAIA